LRITFAFNSVTISKDVSQILLYVNNSTGTIDIGILQIVVYRKTCVCNTGSYCSTCNKSCSHCHSYSYYTHTHSHSPITCTYCGGHH
jgi:hypothetical protein